MSPRNSLLIALSLVISYVCHVRADHNRYGRYLAQAIDAIDRIALEQVPRQELFDGAMRGMVGELNRRGDEHSAFISARDSALFDSQLDQEFAGIGVEIRMLGEPPTLTVVNPPLKDSPAGKAGVRLGDRIVAVDGQRAIGQSMRQLMDWIRGAEGEPVELQVLREGESSPESITVTRAIIETPSVLGDRRDDQGRWDFRLAADPRIGYLRIVNFGSKTAAELQAALDELKEHRIAALLIDVRDDLGGALDAAVAASDMFLSEDDEIVSIRGRDNALDEVYLASGDGASSDGQFQQMPIAILANHDSASASEILAACLQDHGRAIVVGERTFGKGTVQQMIRTEGGRSQLKLTAASFHRPSGKNIHRRNQETPESEDWGVLPNPGFEVPMTDAEHVRRREVRLARDRFGRARQADADRLDSTAESIATTADDSTADDSRADDKNNGGGNDASRDDVANAESSESENSEPENGADGPVDPQLDRAVEYLQGQLAENK